MGEKKSSALICVLQTQMEDFTEEKDASGVEEFMISNQSPNLR